MLTRITLVSVQLDSQYSTEGSQSNRTDIRNRRSKYCGRRRAYAARFRAALLQDQSPRPSSVRTIRSLMHGFSHTSLHNIGSTKYTLESSPPITSNENTISTYILHWQNYCLVWQAGSSVSMATSNLRVSATAILRLMSPTLACGLFRRFLAV